jgi:hypothetical protein
MMPNWHHLFLYYDRPLQIYLHKGWRSTKKSCAPAQRSAFRDPRGERNGNAGGQIPFPDGKCTPYTPSNHSLSAPAIHRGQHPAPENLAARVSAHNVTIFAHRGHKPLLQHSTARGDAHSELQEQPIPLTLQGNSCYICKS